MADISRQLKYARSHKDSVHLAWVHMKQRCTNPNYPEYHYWGGRGITYDPKWETFKVFEQDMKDSYKQGLELDRIDNNGNYCKDNCRWATQKEQANNKRNNRWIMFNGIKKTLSQWAEYLCIKRSTLAQRYYVYKWDINKCFRERGGD